MMAGKMEDKIVPADYPENTVSKETDGQDFQEVVHVPRTATELHLYEGPRPQRFLPFALSCQMFIVVGRFSLAVSMAHI